METLIFASFCLGVIFALLMVLIFAGLVSVAKEKTKANEWKGIKNAWLEVRAVKNKLKAYEEGLASGVKLVEKCQNCEPELARKKLPIQERYKVGSWA